MSLMGKDVYAGCIPRNVQSKNTNVLPLDNPPKEIGGGEDLSRNLLPFGATQQWRCDLTFGLANCWRAARALLEELRRSGALTVTRFSWRIASSPS
jgi:hypothetical protein